MALLDHCANAREQEGIHLSPTIPLMLKSFGESVHHRINNSEIGITETPCKFGRTQQLRTDFSERMNEHA
jgi:hypothetical protein